jgi:hypothetical protein
MKYKLLCIFLLFPYLANSQKICENYKSGLIWCDDFEDNIPLTSKYFEYNSNNGDFILVDGVGTNGSRGMRVLWQKSEVSAGGVMKSFGRTPNSYIGKNAAFPDSTFKEIYWRMDVKHQIGWKGGGPAKLTRALTLANQNWATGLMAHLWSGGGKSNEYLLMDPASGISPEGVLVSTKYNDFDNLRWLGNKKGNIPIFSEENSGNWYCVESHVKLNTPGKSDGVFEFWINGEFQAGSYNLNWHGNWNENQSNYGINAVFFENYWNDGSPAEQERYFDNLIISTERIGCELTSSIENTGIINVITISPNPASDYIEIQVKPSEGLEPSEGYNVQIFNILGIEVGQSSLIVITGQTGASDLLKIDISNLNAGVYFIKIGDRVEKFVKM